MPPADAFIWCLMEILKIKIKNRTAVDPASDFYTGRLTIDKIACLHWSIQILIKWIF